MTTDEAMAAIQGIKDLAKRGADNEQKLLIALAKIHDITVDCPCCKSAVHEAIGEAVGG